MVSRLRIVTVKLLMVYICTKIRCGIFCRLDYIGHNLLKQNNGVVDTAKAVEITVIKILCCTSFHFLMLFYKHNFNGILQFFYFKKQSKARYVHSFFNISV